MSGSPFEVSCVELAEDLAKELVPLAAAAGRALELDRDLAGIQICGDGLPGDDGVWFRFQPASDRSERPVLVLYCHQACFGHAAQRMGAVLPPPAVWEQSPSPPDTAMDAETIFSPTRARMFLHHYLLTARDLARGVVNGRHIPLGLAEAFAEAWAVAVDGRLARLGLAGFPLAERRAKFARVFSPAGILLPDHWQVFQSLWDGALTSQKDVLGTLKRLPGL
jgi:hypothetical protein